MQDLCGSDPVGESAPVGLGAASDGLQLAYLRRMCEAAYAERNRYWNALELVMQHAQAGTFGATIRLTPQEWAQVQEALRMKP